MKRALLALMLPALCGARDRGARHADAGLEHRWRDPEPAAPAKHEATGAPLYEGGPVMRPVTVALFRSPTTPAAPAFQVLKGVYLSMHPESVEKLAPRSARFRLFAGFSGWAPGQLEAESARDGWHVLPASEELVFREDISGLWRKLLDRARSKKTRVYSVSWQARFVR